MVCISRVCNAMHFRAEVQLQSMYPGHLLFLRGSIPFIFAIADDRRGRGVTIIVNRCRIAAVDLRIRGFHFRRNFFGRRICVFGVLRGRRRCGRIRGSSCICRCRARFRRSRTRSRLTRVRLGDCSRCRRGFRALGLSWRRRQRRIIADSCANFCFFWLLLLLFSRR